VGVADECRHRQFVNRIQNSQFKPGGWDAAPSGTACPDRFLLRV
jgi:hypothetical protein